MKKITSLVKEYATLQMLFVSLLLAGWTLTHAQDYTKTYEGDYDVDKGAVVVIKNKFGELQCQTWDQNKVTVVVTVKVDASSQEKANKVFEKIMVDLSGSRTKVLGTTTVENVNNVDFSIDYDIHMPKWANIDFDNRFGDIFITETDGAVKINLEYGAMEVQAFNNPETAIKMKFSEKVIISYLKDGSIDMEYSEMRLRGNDNLKLNSKFSEVSVEKVGNLVLNSQYDDIKIGTAGQVISISRFSEVDFEKINGDFDLDSEYGEVGVSYISAAFKTGKVRNSFAGVDLTFDPKATINVNADVQFGDLGYPRSNASLSHEVIGYTRNVYKGKLGSGSVNVSILTIITKNADVNINFE